MLAFDSELFCISAVEADVVELHRSPEAVSLDGMGSVLPPAQAFVCVLKRERGYEIFLAIHLKDIKKSLVYTVDSIPGGHSSYETSLEKAFVLTEMMGFSMEAVNLNYGKAMREVVLRSVPVLLSPENAARLRREMDAELKELAEKAAGSEEERSPADASELHPEKQVELKRAREKRDEEAKVASRKLAMEKRHTEQAEAVGKAIDKFLTQVNGDEVADLERVERKRLLNENSAMKTRTIKLEERLEVVRAEAGKRIAELEEALRKAEGQIKSLHADLKQAEKARGNLENRIAEAEQAAGETKTEFESESAKRALVAKEKSSIEKRVVELEQMLQESSATAESERAAKERIAQERDALKKRNAGLEAEVREVKQPAEPRKEAQEKVEANKLDPDTRIAELEQAVREARELFESERFERELLHREKTVAEKRAAELELKFGETEVLSEPGRVTQGQIDAARIQSEKRISELEQAVTLAREQTGKERKERERLEKEHALAERRAVKLEKALREAGDRAAEGRQPTQDVDGEIAELREALQKSEERTEYLRLEIESISAAKTAAESRVAELEATGGRADRTNSEGRPGTQALAANQTPKTVPPMDGGEVSPPPHVVRRPPPKGAFFHVDWDMTRINYASPEDVLEVHQSMNLVQLSLEGYHSQHCTAHIVAMKRGKTRQVYIAFGLSESGRTLIYSPAKPIRNKADYSRALSEAVKFVEVVGYMPEKMSLGKSPQALSRVLSDIPVLSGPQN